MATLWYFKNGEHISKPLQPQELKQAVNQGMITATTQVRQGEDGAWFAASQVPGLLTPPSQPMTDSGTFNAQQFARQAFQTGQQYAKVVEQKAGLLDIRFTKFLTPTLVSIIWVIEIIIACLYPVVVFFTILFSAPIIEDVSIGLQFMFILSVVALSTICGVIGLVLGRVCLETTIVLFKIENHLRKE